MHSSLEKCSSGIPNRGKISSWAFFEFILNLACGESKELFFKKDGKTPNASFLFIGNVFLLNSNPILTNCYWPKKSKT